MDATHAVEEPLNVIEPFIGRLPTTQLDRMSFWERASSAFPQPLGKEASEVVWGTGQPTKSATRCFGWNCRVGPACLTCHLEPYFHGFPGFIFFLDGQDENTIHQSSLSFNLFVLLWVNISFNNFTHYHQHDYPKCEVVLNDHFQSMAFASWVW